MAPHGSVWSRLTGRPPEDSAGAATWDSPWPRPRGLLPRTTRLESVWRWCLAGIVLVCGASFVAQAGSVPPLRLTEFCAVFLLGLSAVVADRWAYAGLALMFVSGWWAPFLGFPLTSTAPGWVCVVLGMALITQFRRGVAVSLLALWIVGYAVGYWWVHGPPGVAKALDDAVIQLAVINAGAVMLPVLVGVVRGTDEAQQRREFDALWGVVEDEADRAVDRVRELLHDRVIAVLMAIANTGQADPRLVTSVVDALQARPRVPSEPGGTPLPQLLGGLRQVASGPVDVQLDGPSEGWPALDGARATAVGRALSEVLRNAERHGGTSRLTVRAGLNRAEFRVSVRNAAGDQRWTGGWGWSNSVQAPLRRIGGSASLAHHGDAVVSTLRWPAESEPTATAAQRTQRDTLAALGDSAPTVISVVWLLLAAHTYLAARYIPTEAGTPVQLAAVVAIWAVTVVVARTQRTRALRPLALAAVVAAATAAVWLSLGAAGPSSLLGYRSWVVGMAAVPLTLLAFFSPLTRTVAAVAPVVCVVVALGVGPGGPGLSESAGALSAAAVPMLGFALGRLVRWVHEDAQRTEERLHQRSSQFYGRWSARRTEEALLATTRQQVLPFLQALADGSRSPADADVRRQARLLSLLTRDALYAPGLIDPALQGRILAARGRGVRVSVAPVSHTGDLPPVVVSVGTRLLDRALDHLAPGEHAMLAFPDGEGRAAARLSLVGPSVADWAGTLLPAAGDLPRRCESDDFATVITVTTTPPAPRIPQSDDGAR